MPKWVEKDTQDCFLRKQPRKSYMTLRFLTQIMHIKEIRHLEEVLNLISLVKAILWLFHPTPHGDGGLGRGGVCHPRGSGWPPSLSLLFDLHPPALEIERERKLVQRAALGQDKGEWSWPALICWGQGDKSVSCKTDVDYTGESQPEAMRGLGRAVAHQRRICVQWKTETHVGATWGH